MTVTPAPGVGPHSPTSRTPHPLAVRTRVYDPRSPLPGPAPSPLRAGVGADHTPQLRATPSPQRPSGGLRFPAWTQTPGRVVGGRVPVRTGLVRIPPPPHGWFPARAGPSWGRVWATGVRRVQTHPHSRDAGSPSGPQTLPQAPPALGAGAAAGGSTGRAAQPPGLDTARTETGREFRVRAGRGRGGRAGAQTCSPPPPKGFIAPCHLGGPSPLSLISSFPQSGEGPTSTQGCLAEPAGGWGRARLPQFPRLQLGAAVAFSRRWVASPPLPPAAVSSWELRRLPDAPQGPRWARGPHPATWKPASLRNLLLKR